MVKYRNVGISSRTPYKHFLMDKMLGKLIGALSTGSTKVKFLNFPLLIVDMCAGDGADNLESNTCSPKIIRKHASYVPKFGPFKGAQVPSRTIFYEKNAHTFDLLKDNLQLLESFELRNEDANNFVLGNEIQVENQAVFIHIDPNHINDIPINQDLIDSLTPTTTFLVTLGCNVGGLLRLPQDHRQEWFNKISPLILNVPDFHDALLIVLNRDKAKWAYLARIPAKWSDEYSAYFIKAGNKLWANGVTCYSRYTHGEVFILEELKKLFSTEKEQLNQLQTCLPT